MADILGTGFRFPFQFSDDGGVKTTSDQADGSTSEEGQKDHIFNNIYQLIMTAVGERALRTDLGCGIHDYVFMPADESLVAMILYFVSAIITQWEPRVEVMGISSSIDPQEGTLNVIISLRIKQTNEFIFGVVPLTGGA